MPIFSRFGADFFTVYADFSRFVRDINGEKKISLLMIFFTVSFSRSTPSRNLGCQGMLRYVFAPPSLQGHRLEKKKARKGGAGP